uniref:Uncharacterized protein n=1 Tax=Trichobilharzia regenti TaxID=157069 RepID=A0AA85IX75_TRIRE|nr:unnamed protein product [Trichobilharzia regenti]
MSSKRFVQLIDFHRSPMKLYLNILLLTFAIIALCSREVAGGAVIEELDRMLQDGIDNND